MEEPDDLRLDGMSLEEIEELLVEIGVDLADEPLAELALFLQQLGSLEAAFDALESMNRKAA